ncbi:MAG TPA: DegV family protein [Chloroflexi bacterium]|nr:DegV family protein [Chloroflexota bacterium]
MSKIRIVTDSTADIPPDLAAEYDITVVPAVVVLGSEQYLDGEGLSRAEFYRRLPAMQPLPTTAAPSVGVFAEAYRAALATADTVVGVFLASTLSSIYQNARLAAQDFGERVHVVDSGQLTMGLGFQVLAAARVAREGGSVSDVLEAVQSIQQRVRLVAMLDTLEFLRRSGRVSWAKARLGSLLQLKPFLEVRHGEVISLPAVRTRRKGLARLAGHVEAWGALDYLALLHSGAPEDAEALAAAADTSGLVLPPMTVLVTTVIGTHVGPRGVGAVGVLKA